jgi:PAS domain S-box-containing protein
MGRARFLMMRLSARITAITVALTLLTAAAVGWLTYQRLALAMLSSELERLQTEADRVAERFDATVGGAVADLRAARGIPPLIELTRGVERPDAGGPGSVPARPWEERLAGWFVAELEAKPTYLQFRFIGVDDAGRELVRVDRPDERGPVRVVAAEDLQSKGSRPYFQAALALPPGGVFISPVELNREHGEIEAGDKPVVRVARPLADVAGRVLGVLVINVDLRPLFAELRGSLPPGHSLVVLDEAGRYLEHPQVGRSFAFERDPAAATWRDDFPSLDWALTRGGHAMVGAAEAGGRALCLAAARRELAGARSIAVVVMVDRAVALTPATAVGRSALVAGAAATLLAILVAAFLARSLTRPLAQMTAATEAIGRGEAATLPRSAAGEIGILARAFHEMESELGEAAAALERKSRHERLLSAVVESSREAILAKQLDGTITAWNPAAERMYGFTADQAIGQHVSIIVPEDKLEELETILAQVRHGETLESVETVRRTRDGRRIDVSLQLSPVSSETGELIGVSSIARDIGDRRRAEARFRLAVEASPSGMVMVDRGGMIVLINEETERLFGYARSELIGQPVEVLVPGPLRDQHPGHRASFAAQPARRTMGAGRDLRGRRKDGSEFPVEVGLNPFESPEGPMVLAAVIDIGERLQAQRDLERRTEELQRSNAELEHFAYVASHDLQEPLRMVASFTELLAERYKGKLDEKADMYIGYAVDGARRMQLLIRDLLTYSRVETQGRVPQPTDSRLVFERVLQSMKSAITQSGAEISAQDLPIVLADEIQLGQVFQNVLANAIKFRSTATPRVDVGAKRIGDEWTFSVEDNGIGIESGAGDRIFQMFQRLHGRGEYEGSGIGLAVAKRVVERHGGRIWFESKMGEGTIFHFTFPAANRAEVSA